MYFFIAKIIKFKGSAGKQNFIVPDILEINSRFSIYN